MAILIQSFSKSSNHICICFFFKKNCVKDISTQIILLNRDFNYFSILSLNDFVSFQNVWSKYRRLKHFSHKHSTTFSY